MNARYDVTAYWEKFRNDIKQFVELSDLYSTTPEDQKQCDTLLGAFSSAIEYGLAINNDVNYYTRKIQQILENKPFDPQGIPKITGPKTKNFIKSVFIPHVKRFEKIAGETEIQKEKSRKKAMMLENAVKDYAAAIKKHNLFVKATPSSPKLPSPACGRGARGEGL